MRFDPNPTVDSRDPDAYAKYASRLDDSQPDWWTCDLSRLAPALAAESLKRHPLPCISVRQPWAWALVVGAKPIENRARTYRPIKHSGQVGIHASKASDEEDFHDPRIRAALAERGLIGNGLKVRDVFAFGAIIGTVNITDCHPAKWIPVGYDTCCRPWGEPGPDNWHVECADGRQLPTPVPAKGSLALPWTAPPDVAAQVWAQLVEVTT
jgi:hypothetical protein